MVIKLNNEMVKLLLNEVDNSSSLIDSQKEVAEGLIELDVSDIDELMYLINDEIVFRGLDNQDTVNELGKKLYELYDEILYQ